MNMNTPGFRRTKNRSSNLWLSHPLYELERKGSLGNFCHFVHWNPCPLKVDALISENVRLMNWTAFRCHGMVAIMAISTMRSKCWKACVSSSTLKLSRIADHHGIHGWPMCEGKVKLMENWKSKCLDSDHSFFGQVAWLQWKISGKLCQGPKIYSVPLCFLGLLFWLIFFAQFWPFLAEPDLKDRKISECNSHNHDFIVRQTCIFGEEIQDWQMDSQNPSMDGSWYRIRLRSWDPSLQVRLLP